MFEAPIIYQIHYREDQKPSLDPTFIPYNNAKDDDPLLEFNVFKKIMADPYLEKNRLWGALSWKFTDKTGLTGLDLLTFIEEHPEYDVYYCNPFSEFESLYQNLWIQGETAHPEFLMLCRRIFKVAEIPIKTLYEIQPAHAFAATNYIIGSNRFWQSYIDFIESVLTKVSEGLSDQHISLLYSSKADAKGVHAGANYLPFIVERLFSSFFNTDQGKILRHIKYPVQNKDFGSNSHLKYLREMKDTAWKNRSKWLASCWVNYRNLYLQQIHGIEWAKSYLPNLTPNKLIFSNFPVNI